MALSTADKLRQLLDEQIPEGGSESDTLFTDEEIADLLSTNGNVLTAAAYWGWIIKASKLSKLVDTIEGNSTRKMSQLHAQALEQVQEFRRSMSGLAAGRPRVGKIVRSGPSS